MKNILLALLLFINFAAIGQTEAEKAASTIFKSDIEAQIHFLASDELKGRDTGTDEIKIAASYLANSLRKFNVTPAGDDGSYYQNVPLEKVLAPSHTSLQINDIVGDKFLHMSAKNISFKGEAIYLDYGSPEDFKSHDVKGKLVVVKAGTAETENPRSKLSAGRAKRKLADSLGAAALIELIDLEDKLYDRYSHYFNASKTGLKSDEEAAEKFTHLWMVDKGLENAAALAASKSLKADLNIEGVTIENFSCRNVVGYMEGSDPKLKDEFIIYSAHYDHLGIGKPNAENDSIYNGARDNAVGTVTVLSVAENFNKYPTKRSALFLFFTGEEKGLLGSTYYSEHPSLPLDQMVYCFNSDNGGYNDTSKITIFGLNRTTATHHIVAAAKEFDLTAIDDPAPEQGLFDRSDNVNFAKKGIPAPTYTMGFTSFDEEIMKYYHQASDNPENMDYDYLVKFFKSYVLSSRLIANDPKTPFWTEGDKYYDAGVKLYEKKLE